MADISQIQVGSTTYDVKDSTARSGLSTKQDTISDLATIRSGAALGTTAIQYPENGWNGALLTHSGTEGEASWSSLYYTSLLGKPTINSITVSDSKTSSDYGLLGNSGDQLISGSTNASLTISKTDVAEVCFDVDGITVNGVDTVAYDDIEDTVENAVHKGTVNLSAPGTIRTGSTAPASVTTTGWSVGDLYIYVQS